MTPAQQVRLILDEFRAIGTPFPEAWANAMRCVPRRTIDYEVWKRAFTWAKPAWRAAYEGRGFHVEHYGDDDSTLVLDGSGEQHPPVNLEAELAA